MSTAPTCDICVEKFNKINTKITCISCDQECCKTCFKRYITDHAHYFQCMGCKIEFDRSSLFKRLGATFMKNEYKYIREIMLFEIEKGLFPATQLILEKEKEIEKLEKDLELVQDKFAVIQAEKQNVLNEFCKSTKVQSVQETIDQYVALCEEVNVDDKIQEETALINKNIDELKNTSKGPKKTFIRQCSQAECNGMLSEESRTPLMNYKCILCNSISCTDCREICANENEHECNKETLETIKFIDESSKPCPSCASPIYKIAGCFDKNTIIPMWDGINKFVNEITVGDTLIGDDFKPRKVLERFTGTDYMFQVDQEHGKSYVVNSKHNLALVKENGSKWIIDISTYMELSEEIKGSLYGYKIVNDLDIIKSKLTITPYGSGRYYGFMLDGNNKFLFSDNTVLCNCDQMWCTSCNTAFSWKTLKIVNGTIHNPHYFEYMRRNGQQDRDPQDIQCGQEVTHRIVVNIQSNIRIHMGRWRATMDPTEYNKLNTRILDMFTLIERIPHHHNYTIRRLQATNIFNQNRNMRLQLLRKQINETEFRIKIQRSDKAESKKRDILNIVVTFRDCASSIAFRLFTDASMNAFEMKTLVSYIDELNNLREYIDECLEQTAVVYSSTTAHSILHL